MTQVNKEVFDMHVKECDRRHKNSERSIKELRDSTKDDIEAIRRMTFGVIITLLVTAIAGFANAALALLSS